MNIVDQQFIAQMPVAELQTHPQNPNRGNIGAISESISNNGYYGCLGFQRSTNRILFGNHRFEAAKLAGATHVPALSMDVDDDAALRIMLVDNRVATFAENDNEMLADILQHLATSQSALDGTGFTPEYLDELLLELGAIHQNIDNVETEQNVSQFILTIHCANEHELENLFHEMTERGLTCKMLT